MKHVAAVLLMLLFASLGAANLKVGVVDYDKIMSRSKDVADAQKTFETEYQAWKKQAQDLEDEYKKMESEYASKELILTEDGKRDAQTKIQTKKDEYQSFVNDILSENGRASRRNSELLEPVMQRLRQVVEQVALEDDLDIIFDISRGGLVYIKPSLDVTDRVIDALNRAGGTTTQENNQ